MTRYPVRPPRMLKIAKLSEAGISELNSTVNAGAQAATQPPQPSAVGRMELLHHWDRLDAEKRVALLTLARGMT